IPLDNGLYTINVDYALDEVGETDLIIVPPMSGDMETAVSENREYVRWIRQQYEQGAEVASLCVGAFILAETGLLNGQKCSTHWKTVNEFREMFPEVNLVDHRIITDHNGLYTSGGANSYWNLLVYLVQKFTNRDIAIKTSKYFEVEMDRNNQATFMIFEGYKLHPDETILGAQEYIERNYKEGITIGFLCEKFNMSRRTFQRRFKAATQETVIEYLQKIRIEAAKKLLESNRLSVSEIMFETGYNDPNAFRDVFKKITGITPSVYKSKYDLMIPTIC
ncbi:MAG TPA: helix-turn-helix domain-containing protein, partial [Pricia sp.]|nr:helix-turn-helix domain-containing protein [Pricia sp.]